jgi:transposase
MRVGLYRPVHVKTLASQKRRMLLTSRQLLQAKALDIENDLRGTLRNFGLKVGMVGTVKFEARIRELVADHPDLAAIVEPLLIARRKPIAASLAGVGKKLSRFDPLPVTSRTTLRAAGAGAGTDAS